MYTSLSAQEQPRSAQTSWVGRFGVEIVFCTLKMELLTSLLRRVAVVLRCQAGPPAATQKVAHAHNTV